MGLHTDEAIDSTLRLFLPVDIFEKCCHLDNGQSLHMDGTGHKKDCKIEMVRICIKRLMQQICLEIEAPTLQKTFTDSCYVINPTSKQDTAECYIMSELGIGASLQVDLNHCQTDEPINIVTESELRTGRHHGKSHAIKVQGTEACHETSVQDSTRKVISKKTVPENKTASARVITRSMKKNQCKSLQEKSMISGRSRCTGRLAKRQVKMGINKKTATCCLDSSVELECRVDDQTESCGIILESSNQLCNTVPCESFDVENKTRKSTQYVTSETVLLEDSQGRVQLGNKSIKNRRAYLGKTSKKRCAMNGDSSICDLCSKRFSHIQQLNRHKALKHAIYIQPNRLCCLYCKAKFRTAHERKLHQFYKCSENSNTSEPNVCDQCNKPFQTRNQMVAHMNHFHRSNLKMACVKCCATFLNRGSLHDHMITVHHINTIHRCLVCDKVFPGRYALKRHMMRASCIVGKSAKSSSTGKAIDKSSEPKLEVKTTNEESALCPKCGKCFKSHRAVSSHLVSAHTKEWPYKCDKCERLFKLQKNFDSHRCALHKNAPPQKSTKTNRGSLPDRNHVPCPLCDVTKVSYNSLYKHFLSHHKQHPRYDEELNKLKPLMRVWCDHCGLDFSTSTNLGKHLKLRKCTGQQSSGIRTGQPCPFCAKISASVTHLAQHMQLMHRHHPRFLEEDRKLRAVLTVQCEICGNWYPDMGSWRQHHTNAHAEDRHRCPYCRKPFRLKTSLQIHINHRHLGLPYEKSTRRYFHTCKRCPQSFLTKKELEEHVKTEHSRVKQIHQCDKCSFMYSEIKEYFLHHRKVHSTEGMQCSGCGSLFRSLWFLKKHTKGCSRFNTTLETSDKFQSHDAQSTRNADNAASTAIMQSLQVSDDNNVSNADAVFTKDGGDLVHIITPIITPVMTPGSSVDSKQPISNCLLLSSVFNDCIVTGEAVHVSQVTEVTTDTTGQVVEEAIAADFHGNVQITEDNVVKNERVIYLSADSTLDITELPLGTVMETTDGAAYWNDA